MRSERRHEGIRALQRGRLPETPDDELIADRLGRSLARRAGALVSTTLGSLAALARGTAQRDGKSSIPPPQETAGARPSCFGCRAHCPSLTKRIDRGPAPASSAALSFDLAEFAPSRRGKDVPRATSLLETLVTAQPEHIPALRTLESIYRKSGAWAPGARDERRSRSVSGRAPDASARSGNWPRRRSGSCRWTNPAAHSTGAFSSWTPRTPVLLEATFRRELPNARQGDPRSRKAVGRSDAPSLCNLRPMTRRASPSNCVLP